MMRENVLRKLREFNNQLAMLDDNLADRNLFIDTDWLSGGTMLHAYNTVVLSWIKAWALRFHEAIMRLSAFEAENSDADIEKILERMRRELKVFSDLRHVFLPKGIRELSRAPFMIAHVALLHAVELVRTKEESTCLWLMPWITNIIGSAETNVKSATEDAKGQFNLWEYMHGETDDSLIAVMDYLDYVRDSRPHADEFFSSDARQWAITKAQGTPALNYIRALQYYHIRSTAEPTHFGFHVAQFAIALHESSVNRLGKEFSAHSDYEACVIAFYRLWESPTLGHKESIRSSRAPHFPHTFEEYLLTLFITVPSIPLHEEVKARAEKKEIIKCAAILSSILLAFVRNHKHWYEIPVGESSEKLIYTPDDLDHLRETLKKSLSGYSRIYHIEDAVAESLKSCHHESYRYFFALSELIPMMREADLLKMAENPKQTFSETGEILAFLTQLPSSSDRIKYWRMLETFWKKLRFSAQEVIFLFYLFDDNAVVYLKDLFSGKIRGFFTLERLPHDFTVLKKVCAQFTVDNIELDYKNVYRSFIMKIITHAPEMISDSYAFSRCFTAFTTEEEFCTVVHTLNGPLMACLFANRDEKFNGAMLLEFFNIMRNANRKNPFQFDLNNAFFTVIKSVLPLLQLNERINGLCEAQSTCACSCWSLFSTKNKSDRMAYKKLLLVDDDMKAGKLSYFDGCYEKIIILRDFMKNKTGAQFLALVNRYFCVKFFNAVCDVVSATNAHHSHRLSTLMLGT